MAASSPIISWVGGIGTARHLTDTAFEIRTDPADPERFAGWRCLIGFSEQTSSGLMHFGGSRLADSPDDERVLPLVRRDVEQHVAFRMLEAGLDDCLSAEQHALGVAAAVRLLDWIEEGIVGPADHVNAATVAKDVARFKAIVERSTRREME